MKFAKDHTHHTNVDVQRTSFELLMATIDTLPELLPLVIPLLVSNLPTTDFYIRKILIDFWRKLHAQKNIYDTKISSDVQTTLIAQLCAELNLSTEDTSWNKIQDLFDLYEASFRLFHTSCVPATSVISLDDMLADIFIHHGCECIELDLD
jgi:hypothetical protein